MARRPIAPEDRGVDVKCHIPFRLRKIAGARGLRLSHVLAWAIETILNSDIDGGTFRILEERKSLLARVEEIDTQIQKDTGRPAEAVECDLSTEVGASERRRYLALYRGMNPKGTRPDMQEYVKAIAAGNNSRRGCILSWLRDRSKDFGIFEPEDKALEKLIRYKPWESEDDESGEA